jgi:hypothetical protein
MSQSKIQYQAGLSLTQFTEQYGTESQCEAALEKARWPEGYSLSALWRCTLRGDS